MKAIEIASAQSWNKLWIKSDSTYLISLLKSRSLSVPWNHRTRWLVVLELMNHMQIVSSHIYREDNQVADALSKFVDTVSLVVECSCKYYSSALPRFFGSFAFSLIFFLCGVLFFLVEVFFLWIFPWIYFNEAYFSSLSADRRPTCGQLWMVPSFHILSFFLSFLICMA